MLETGTFVGRQRESPFGKRIPGLTVAIATRMEGHRFLESDKVFGVEEGVVGGRTRRWGVFRFLHLTEVSICLLWSGSDAGCLGSCSPPSDEFQGEAFIHSVLTGKTWCRRAGSILEYRKRGGGLNFPSQTQVGT